MTTTERKVLSLKNPAIFYGAIVVGIIALVLSIYYFIPGVHHVLVSGDPNAVHLKHAVGLLAIAIVCGIGALVTRPKPSTN